MMKPLRVYVDTSVLGGCFDREFCVASQRLLEAIRRGEVVALLSDLLAAEIGRGPEPVRDLLGQMLEAGGERLEMTEAALALQEAYLAAGIVRPASADDALHVALATLARADVLVSWNFRHLVNPARVRAFNGVNLASGYGMLVILTPADVVPLLEERDDEPDA